MKQSLHYYYYYYISFPGLGKQQQVKQNPEQGAPLLSCHLCEVCLNLRVVAYLCSQVFFYVPGNTLQRRDRHFTWSSEPREIHSLQCCQSGVKNPTLKFLPRAGFEPPTFGSASPAQSSRKATVLTTTPR